MTLNLLINLRGVTTFVGTSLVTMAHALCLGGDDIKDCQLVAPTTRADNTRGLSVATMYRKLKAVGDDEAASTRLNTAIARARHRVWAQLEDCNPACVASIDNPMVVDIDATLIAVHSDKEQARANRGNYGYHPLVAAVDYGDQLGGEILRIMCRAGNAGANTATDHITMLSSILDAVGHSHGDGTPWGKRLAIRVDGAGGTKQFLQHLHDQKLGFIVGLPTTHAIVALTHDLTQSGV
ncbi:transposase [Corynebacterium cystitidis]|uniref:transposase n=1 Tax=Corynebacterium cystitidis TaxID=35757 RepID=UPI0012FD1239|nr:transposase [Corynebacterium cystitidis]